MADKKAFDEPEVDDTTVDLTKGIFRGSKNDGSGSWFIKLTNLFKLLLRSDGSTVGATGQVQNFTEGVRSGDNGAGTESKITKDGIIASTNNTDSTYSQLHPDGSLWMAGKAGAIVGGTKKYYKKIHLTSEEIQAGSTTQIVLIPAAGAGTVIKAMLDTTARCINGAVAAKASSMVIRCGGRQIGWGPGFLGSATSNPIMPDTTAVIDIDTAISENTALTVQFDDDNDGFDGTIDIYLWFEIKVL